MKIAIVLAAICFLGVAFAGPTPAPSAAAKPNAFADWQKAFQETLNNLLGQNKNKPKREAASAAPERKLTQNVFADAAVAMQNAFKQAMDNAFKQQNNAGVAVERVARQERLPEWEPTFKDQMKANAYGIVGVGNLLEYMDAKKAKKAQKSKREGEATPASAKEFSVKDFGKMVDDFYAQFQAPKKVAAEKPKRDVETAHVQPAKTLADKFKNTSPPTNAPQKKKFQWVLNGRNWVKSTE